MLDDVSDLVLLSRWGAGDQIAGEALASRYFWPIYRFFRRRVPEMADDLTQQTFLGCVEGRARVKQMASFRAYLFGIARNQLLMHLRKGQERDRERADAPVTEPSPSRVLAEVREHKVLVRALRSLPLEAQLICEMFYWEGLKAREIGDVLELPTSTVTSRLAKARELLRQRVIEFADGIDGISTTAHNIEAWARSLADAVDGTPATSSASSD